MQSIRTGRNRYVRDSSLEYLAQQKFAIANSQKGKTYYTLDPEQGKPLKYWAQQEHRNDVIDILNSIQDSKQ